MPSDKAFYITNNFLHSFLQNKGFSYHVRNKRSPTVLWITAAVQWLISMWGRIIVNIIWIYFSLERRRYKLFHALSDLQMSWTEFTKEFVCLFVYFGNFWSLLEPFGAFWNLLKPFGTFWNFHASTISNFIHCNLQYDCLVVTVTYRI